MLSLFAAKAFNYFSSRESLFHQMCTSSNKYKSHKNIFSFRRFLVASFRHIASGSHTAWPHRGGQNPLSNTLCRYRNSSLRDTTTINCPCKNTTGWRSCMCHLHANMTSIRRSRKNQKRVNKSYAESKSKFTERPV